MGLLAGSIGQPRGRFRGHFVQGVVRRGTRTLRGNGARKDNSQTPAENSRTNLAEA